MLDSLISALRAQLDNQLFAGGLALGLVGVLLAMLRKLPGMLWHQVQRALVVTAVVDSRNDLFGALIQWLDARPFGRRSRLFTAVQTHADPDADGAAPLGDSPARLPRLLFSPAPGLHLFWHDGRLMWIERDLAMNLQVIETLRINALFGSRQQLEGLLRDALHLAHAGQADHTPLYVIDRWGEAWQKADTRRRRPLDSVVLDGHLRDQILGDARSFFERRDEYARLGIPWRRGYLLHGPPGTGKTSLAHALAGELRLNLCLISLTHPKVNDQTISDLLQKTPPRSLILIEDVDAFYRDRDKQQAAIEVSFSGLLNALDGVAAQEGRILVMTTNHRNRLDPALIRPGRIDLVMPLALASAQQVADLFLRFFPDAAAQAAELRRDMPDQRLSPAAVQQALLANPDAAAAMQALRSAAWKAAALQTAVDAETPGRGNEPHQPGGTVTATVTATVSSTSPGAPSATPI